ncbi:MAG: hypothetical protein IJ776_09850 [Paludibacteraceae bacterium]|nr:hypothetical protein [Paludibacteraceae bacterium]
MNDLLRNIVCVLVLLLPFLVSCKVHTVLCKTEKANVNAEYSNDTTEQYVFDWRTNNKLVITHQNAHNSSCRKAKVSFSGDTLYVRESTQTAPLEAYSSWSYTIPIEDRNYIVVKADSRQIFPIMKRDTSVTFMCFESRVIKGDGELGMPYDIIGKKRLEAAYDEDGFQCRSATTPYDKRERSITSMSGKLPVVKLFVNSDYTWQLYENDRMTDCGILTITVKKNLWVCYKNLDLNLDVLSAGGDFYDAWKATGFKYNNSRMNIGPMNGNMIPIVMFYGCFHTQQRVFHYGDWSVLHNDDECIVSIMGNCIIWKKI